MQTRFRARSTCVAMCAAVVLLAIDSTVTSADSNAPPAPRPSSRLVVHEWGTFTCLEDEQGRAIRGINEDDEPVPQFVHRIANFLLLAPNAEIPILYQGAPACHPSVTMRLETPVIYFHPPAAMKLPIAVDVDVAFHGGWLSEYYPNAEVEAPGVTGQGQFGFIDQNTIGRLRWKNLKIGTDGITPATSAPVWLSPRNVRSAAITSDKNEHEQFLFYRGVGHVDAPVHVVRHDRTHRLSIEGNYNVLTHAGQRPASPRKFWLVSIHSDQACAFRELSAKNAPVKASLRVSISTPDSFQASDFRRDGVANLTASMRSALIDDGLYPDEADALLNTWKLSYFQSPGLRLFYLLPRTWTDNVLPLRVSTDAELVRTMVGRIEIVSPEQRRLLGAIAQGPASTPIWARPNQPNPHAPADFQAYQKLGRFRNALLLDEQNHHPTPSLSAFIKSYGLQGYRWPAGSAPANSAEN